MSAHSALHPLLTTGVPLFLWSVAASSVFLLLALVACQLLTKEAAATRYKLLFGALMAFSLPLPLLFLLVVNRDVLTISEVAAGSTPATRSAPLRSDTTPVVHSDTDWECAVGVVIGIVAFLGLLRLGRQALSARRGITPFEDPATIGLARIVDELRLEMKVNVPVAVIVVREAIAPVVIGIRNPVVVLPLVVLQLGMPQLRTVMMHELSHVRRRDNLANVFERIVGRIYWFNPLLPIFGRQLALAREQACDEVAAMEGASIYLEALLCLCRETSSFKDRPAVSCISNSNIGERVDSFMRLNQHSSSPTRRVTTIGFTVIAGIASVLGIALTVEKPLYATSTAAETSSPKPALWVTPPRIQEVGKATYTTEARANRVAGTVTLEVDIDAEGKLQDARVLKGLPDGLNQSAIDAVRRWKFSSALDGDGIPAPSTFNIVLSFDPDSPKSSVDAPSDRESTRKPGFGFAATLPQVLDRSAEPAYTAQAREQRVAGIVIVQVDIDPTGTLVDARVLKGLPFGLADSSLVAVRQWKFASGRDTNGVAVPSSLNVTVKFQGE